MELNGTGGDSLKTIAVVGPTASGKTRRAVDLARRFNGEVVSCDSRQVYRGMTIGTGKDTEEYGEVPVWLLDICDAGEKYNLHRFITDFNDACKDIHKRGKRVVACGGSGMYVENALSGIRLPEVPHDEELRRRLAGKSLDELTHILGGMKRLHNVTDVDTEQRAIRAIEIAEYYAAHPEESDAASRLKAKPMDAVIIGVDIDRENRRRRITERLHARLEQGMLEEVEHLLDSGIPPEDLIYYGLEYKYVTLHLIRHLDYDEMVCALETAIHQFAKRQMTWFRGMERRGFTIHWLPYDMGSDEFTDAVASIIS